jgi:hypothetical protein
MLLASGLARSRLQVYTMAAGHGNKGTPQLKPKVAVTGDRGESGNT